METPTLDKSVDIETDHTPCSDPLPLSRTASCVSQRHDGPAYPLPVFQGPRPSSVPLSNQCRDCRERHWSQSRKEERQYSKDRRKWHPMATLLQWNFRVYRANYEDLQLLINYNQPYCVCLQKTQLGLVTPRPPTGYSMYTDPLRPAVPGQWLAILVRDDVLSYMINVSTTLATTVIRVKSQHEYTICNLYEPPNKNMGQNSFLNLLN